MKSYNNVTLVGRVVRQPDIKDAESSAQRATFTLAVDRPYKDDEGNSPSDFFPVTAWGKLADICADYVTKGALILISGKLQSRSYESNNETVWIIEVIAESVNILSEGKK